MTSQRVKNKKARDETKSSGVVLFCSLHAVTSSVIDHIYTITWLLCAFSNRCNRCSKCNRLQFTHTGKSYLFVLYNKNSNGLLKDFWGMKKEKQLCPLIDHGQQPMKMHTEVTLLYKYIYLELYICYLFNWTFSRCFFRFLIMI